MLITALHMITASFVSTITFKQNDIIHSNLKQRFPSYSTTYVNLSLQRARIFSSVCSQIKCGR